MTRLLALALLGTACTPTPLDQDGGGYVVEPGEDEPIEEPEPPESIRIGTFNIRFLDSNYDGRNEVDYAVIAELIEELEVDVFALQEIDGDGAIELLHMNGLDDRFDAEVASAGWSINTVLLYDREVVELTRPRELMPTDEAFRSVQLAQVRVLGSDFAFVMGSLHLASNYDPTHAENRFYEAQGLYEWITTDMEEQWGEVARNYAFAGDWNDTFESIDPEWPALDPFLADEEMVFATHNTDEYTLVGWESKIDHILLSDDLSAQWTGIDDPIEGCEVFAHDQDPYFGRYDGGYGDTQNISDHRPVMVELALP